MHAYSNTHSPPLRKQGWVFSVFEIQVEDQIFEKVQKPVKNFMVNSNLKRKRLEEQNSQLQGLYAV